MWGLQILLIKSDYDYQKEGVRILKVFRKKENTSFYFQLTVKNKSQDKFKVGTHDQRLI